MTYKYSARRAPRLIRAARAREPCIYHLHRSHRKSRPCLLILEIQENRGPCCSCIANAASLHAFLAFFEKIIHNLKSI